MIKAQAPKYNTAKQRSEPSIHLWDDFMKQVGGYARRNNKAYRNIPLDQRHEAKSRNQVTAAAWYNQAQTSFSP